MEEHNIKFYENSVYEAFKYESDALLENIENKRQEALSTIVFSAISIVAIDLILYIKMHSVISEDIFIIICIIAFILIIGVCRYSYVEYRKYLKQNVLGKIIDTLGFISFAKRGSVVKNDTILNSGLVDYYSNRTDDDCFYGKLGGTEFSICETRLYRRSNKRDVTVFNGIFLELQARRYFRGKTIVNGTSKIADEAEVMLNEIKYPMIVLGVAFILFLMFQLSRVLNFAYVIALSLPFALGMFMMLASVFSTKDEIGIRQVFSKHGYAIDSDNKEEALNVATNKLITSMRRLKNNIGASSVRASFCGDKVLIKIATVKDFFEVGDLLKPTKTIEDFMHIAKEFWCIFNFIETFTEEQDCV